MNGVFTFFRFPFQIEVEFIPYYLIIMLTVHAIAHHKQHLSCPICPK